MEAQLREREEEFDILGNITQSMFPQVYRDLMDLQRANEHQNHLMSDLYQMLRAQKNQTDRDRVQMTALERNSQALEGQLNRLYYYGLLGFFGLFFLNMALLCMQYSERYLRVTPLYTTPGPSSPTLSPRDGESHYYAGAHIGAAETPRILS